MENYQEIGKKVQENYNPENAALYRKNDEDKLQLKDIQHYKNNLSTLTNSFNSQIDVLDLGCGTGLYFHSLKNVKILTGVDIAVGMLEMAKNPVKKDEITIKSIKLINSNFFDLDFPENSFDFIYSIGVLGEYSPFDSIILNKIFKWLKKGGKIYFTIMDVDHQPKQKFFNWAKSFVFQMYLQILKGKKRHVIKKFPLNEKHIKQVLSNIKFSKMDINHYFSPKDEWNGAHFECFIEK